MYLPQNDYWCSDDILDAIHDGTFKDKLQEDDDIIGGVIYDDDAMLIPHN